jgi:hypothetical protein
MNRLLISLAALPCIPLVLFGAIFIFVSNSFGSTLWILSVCAVVFGFAGLIGLIMAGFKRTYRYKNSRLLSLLLIICGYVAVGFGIAWCVISYQMETQYGPPGGLARPFPIVQYSIVGLLLMWPLSSGVVAIISLVRSNT